MKDFIVIAMVLVLILIFPIQFALEQKNHSIRSYLQTTVDSIKTDLRVNGGASPDAANKLIQLIYNLDKKKVAPNANFANDKFIDDQNDFFRYYIPGQGTVSRGNIIQYEVQIKLDQVLAGYKFFGLTDDEASAWYTIRGAVVSEYVSAP